jgi:hypothetical protein
MCFLILPLGVFYLVIMKHTNMKLTLFPLESFVRKCPNIALEIQHIALTCTGYFVHTITRAGKCDAIGCVYLAVRWGKEGQVTL